MRNQLTNLEYLEKYYKGNINDAIERLNNGEAVQYIVGNMDFYGYNYNITHDTLIPRFETEGLVERLIFYIKKYFNNEVSILDIGTGSGCIAITLANEINSKLTASDISKKALEIAALNNKKYGNKVNLIDSDIFNNSEGKFDVIVSNPPYIAYNEEVMDIVKNNEPSIALYADDNGLYFYKEILKNADKYLNDKHIIAFEIGEGQGNSVISIAKKYFKEDLIFLEQDLYKRDRYVFIIRK